MTSKELVERLKEMKIPVKNHASTLVDAYVDKIRKELGPELEKRGEQAREDAAKDVAEEQASAEEEERKRLEEEHKKAAQAEMKRRQKEQKRREAAEAEAKAASQQDAEAAEEEEAKAKPARSSVFDGLLSQIAAESNRLTQEKREAAEARNAEAEQTAPEPAQAESPYREKGAKKKKKGRQQVEVDSESEDDRYRQMAQVAEQLQRDKVLEEARAAVAEAEKQSTGRRKKRKERRAAEAAKKAEEEAQRKAEITGVPVGVVQVTSGITVGELADALEVPGNEVVKRLFLLGTPLTLTQSMSDDLVELIAGDIGREVKIISPEEEMSFTFHDDEKDLKPRPPVVTVMGHVDHGKTSILDAIRHANVTAGEAGGITQHIGAYRVNIDGKDITFLDTPGHAAFTTMRARGAMVTDIAVLVVAADDGIMPQTVEAINHAKAAGVSIIVAINKMDKPAANPDLVKQQLTEYELVPEEWGGDVPCIPVSAHTKMGIDDLLEMILLVAEMKELKANPDRAAKGTVIEARLDKGRGPVATVLVQNGTLHTGDIVVAGTTVGRIRAMMNERGERVKSAGPSVPVEVTGLNEVPVGGDTFNAVSDERLARELVEQRLTEQKEEMFNSQTKVTLDNLFEQMKEGEMKELKVIVKADVQGSVEAVRQSLEKLSNDEVRVHVIHGAVGAISESDVMLANASNAIIVGFNVRPDPVAEENAKRDGVDMRLYRIIYDCIEEIESAMKGMLAPKYREVFLGKAECREVYKITNVGMVIGGHVTSGKIVRGAQVRLVRDGIIVADDKIASLRRFKDDVKEVQDGYDCGITLERFSDIKLGDILEAYEMEEYRD